MNADKPQVDRFKEAARELGTDDNEDRFNEKLRKLVKQKPDDKKPSDGQPGLSRSAVMPHDCLVCQVYNPQMFQANGRSHDMTDKMREALAFYTDDANWRQNGPLDPNSANFTGGPARAALAAVPQPAPADRDALVEVIDAAITRWLQDGYDDPRNKPEAVADALLARGLRLPEDGETLAWAVIEDGIISPNLIDSEKESVQRWAEAWKGSMVRVAIRVVEEGDDGA